MLSNLLITWKNGSSGKTYGVIPYLQNNMKFCFIWLVILLYSVCASGDLEIFPGYKFGISSEEYRRRLAKVTDEALYNGAYSHWPWQKYDNYRESHAKGPYKYDIDIPLRFRQLEDFIDKNTNTPDKDDEMAYYYPKERLEQVYEDYRSGDPNPRYDPYQMPSNPILSDVRPYPQDDDFSFQNEDEPEEAPAQSIRTTSRYLPKSTSFSNLNLENLYNYHDNDKPEQEEDTRRSNNEEASGRSALEEAKLVDDPTEFAYAPPDPRFYESSTVNENNLTIPSEPEDDTKSIEQANLIQIKQRSDENFIQSSNPEQQIKFYGDSDVEVQKVQSNGGGSIEISTFYLIAIIAGMCAVGIFGLAALGIAYYKLQKHVKNASDVEYPAYGITGPNKDVSPSGDRKLAQSAQMYHYQHQKQQIVAMEKSKAAGERHHSNSDLDSDEENEEGDYTVYECPGLAPTGEMEVKNPLFQDDQTPMDAPQVKIGEENQK